MTQHLVHVTFGTDEFSQALERLRRSARRFSIRDVRIYGLNHPAVVKAADENPMIMKQTRGAGYWLWKPYILLDTLRTVEEGTIVVYSDAGHRYIADPSPLIKLTKSREIVLFSHRAKYLQRHWTKRDCFVLMGADEPQYWDTRQLDASIQIYVAGSQSQSFLLELQDAMRDPRILCDEPNMLDLPNLDGFIGHRHDQSILTILAKKHEIETFPTPKVVNLCLPESNDKPVRKPKLQGKGGVVFEHHRRTNERRGAYWRRLVEDFLDSHVKRGSDRALSLLRGVVERRPEAMLCSRGSTAESSIRWGYKRPMRIGLAEVLAERRLCNKFGWDVDLFTGKASVRIGGSGAGRLLHPHPLLFQLRPKIEALRIARWSRFGNSVMQLRNALQLAECLNIKIIEFAQQHPFFRGRPRGRV